MDSMRIVYAECSKPLKHQTETVGTIENAVCFENTEDWFILEFVKRVFLWIELKNIQLYVFVYINMNTKTIVQHNF
jgi:hypothetical protein